MQTKEQAFEKLEKSKFRSGFHLSKEELNYIDNKGLGTIRGHAEDFVGQKLAPAYPHNDGKQTPMRQVHPVFIAQHACACCCRSCLYKWYKIEKGKELSDKEIDFIVSLLIKWIEKELSVK